MGRRKAKKESWYVLFGFDKDDYDHVGYFSKDLKIADDIHEAKMFSDKDCDPAKWRDLVNEDALMNHGFKFHLIKTLLKPEQ